MEYPNISGLPQWLKQVIHLYNINIMHLNFVERWNLKDCVLVHVFTLSLHPPPIFRSSLLSSWGDTGGVLYLALELLIFKDYCKIKRVFRFVIQYSTYCNCWEKLCIHQIKKKLTPPSSSLRYRLYFSTLVGWWKNERSHTSICPKIRTVTKMRIFSLFSTEF